MNSDLIALIDRPCAPRWRRLSARVVDLAISAMIVWTLAVFQVFGLLIDWTGRTSLAPWGEWWLAAVLFALTFGALDIVFTTWNKGQTPGKDLLRIRVVGSQPNGDVRAAQAVTRAALPVTLILIRPLWLSALVTAAWLVMFGLSRPAAHELISATRVVPYNRSVEDPAAPRFQPRRRSLLVQRYLPTTASEHEGRG